ncbi:MAG: hypothetical protein CMJ81_12965 [Planctomycetaceae bacterium]|nr:hypothetical protein [Planctomycetaceae bacterium]
MKAKLAFPTFYLAMVALLVQPAPEDPWSLRPLARARVPATDSAWVRTPIDAFILARLQQHGFTPSGTANRRSLIRRLTFDLHGLPPTPDETRAFLNDTSPRAYQNLVDRLLASPRYGERWARHWLDTIHYGETHGYDKDKIRSHAWPYRDWVITSLNEDKSYTRFVQEQIAGDVLYPDDADATIALGFIAAGPWDFVGHVELREGTADKKIARSLDRDDMVTNAMSNFASTTVHCARCHDHKFDPIPQRDYYRLQAIFAGVERADRPYTSEQRPAFISKDIGTLGWHSKIMPRADMEKWVQVDLGASHRIDEILLFPAHVVYGGHPGPGFGFPPRFRIDVSDDPDFASFTAVTDQTSGNYPHPGNEIQAFEGPGAKARFVRITATKLWQRTEDWIFALGELAVRSGTKNLAAGAKVTSSDSIEAGRSWGRQYLTDESAHIARSKLVYAVATNFPPQGNFTPPKTPRDIHILHRGNVLNPGPAATPGALSCLPHLDHHFATESMNDEGQRRASFARWLTDPENPLVWRSIVNRVWQHHFGRGLVDTPNDFGKMGNKPTHPKLLDWLARNFRDGKGSLKQLHRLILLSATYRQASSSRPGSREESGDIGNNLLWRMNRRRLEAEAVRDSVLAISGQLDTSMGGPSARWFGLIDDHSPHFLYQDFDPDDVAGRRRSIYRLIVRSVPDPFMETLDCADPSLLTPKRHTTLTALQALTLLNNPFMVRQSEHFATRIEKASSEPRKRVAQAVELALNRRPNAIESRRLIEHAQQHGFASMCRLILNLNEFIFVD